MSQLPLTNVINISVATAQQGLNDYNTSNVGLITDETPDPSFGDDGFKIYLEPSEVGEDFGTDSVTYQMAVALFSQQPNILNGNGSLVVMELETDILTTLNLYKDVVQFFGLTATMPLDVIGETDLLATAAVIQTLNKIAVFVSFTEADIDPGGMIDKLRTGGFTQTRGLYYGDGSDSGLNALLMAAAYCGRAFSTNFDGSNTTQTMHLKPLTTIQPDPTMTQTILNKALAAGADTYPSIQGVPCVFCSGENSFFDQVYNLQWFVGALQVAGFNYLAQSATKVPQTENGMDGLKGAYRRVCERGITNQYMAPGSWNSPTTFGNQVDLLANVLQFGYYIYSQPVNQQSQTSRAARQAPLVQIAVKEAGAVQKSNVIIYVNP